MTSSYTNCIMMEAAKCNNWPEVFRLFREGQADINYRDEIGWSPLCVAVAYVRKDGTEGIVSKLLRLGAEVNIDLPRGVTLLMEAKTGNIVRCLLEAGANPLVRNEFGYSVLEWYLRKDRLDAARTLRKLTNQPCIPREVARYYLFDRYYEHFELGTGVELPVADKEHLERCYARKNRERQVSAVLRRLCPWLSGRK